MVTIIIAWCRGLLSSSDFNKLKDVIENEWKDVIHLDKYNNNNTTDHQQQQHDDDDDDDPHHYDLHDTIDIITNTSCFGRMR